MEDPAKRKRLVFTCNLKDDPGLIAAYKKHHQKIWPEITASIRDKGVHHMEIYLAGTRMFMIMEVESGFSMEEASKMDAANPKVQEWETLMGRFQKTPPMAVSGEKWVYMEKIFDLDKNG